MALQDVCFLSDPPDDRVKETKDAVDRAVAATDGVRELLRRCNGRAATMMRKALTDGLYNSG